MPSSFAEKLLARAIGSTRAAAIYGDLIELAATRGQFWFWATYTRTLLVLNWRAPVAFVLAIASVMAMTKIYPMWVQYALRHLAGGLPVNMFFGRLAVASAPLLNLIAMCLWFALPFAWMRFGQRDRVARLACLLFFATLPVYSFREWLVAASTLITLVVLLATALSPHWRRAFAVLTLTFATTVAAIVICFHLLAMASHRAFQTFLPTRGVSWRTTILALGIAAFVCSRLHRWLLPPAAPGNVNT